MKVEAARWKPGASPPADGVLLIRHGPRPGDENPPLSTGLTDEGRQACVHLGTNIKFYRPSAILSSPFDRCVDTGICIVNGAGWELAVRPSCLLGDPGPFVIPEQIALTDDPRVVHARDHNDWKPLLQRHARGENVPGLKHRDQGTRSLCKRLFSNLENGYILCISHHSIIAAIMASLGLPADPWPDFLEGVVISRP